MSGEPSELAIAVREQTGVDAGRVHHLRPGRHVIGRDPSLSVSLRCADVSRQHAVLEVSPAAVVVTDLGSKNGVLLKQRQATTRLSGPTRLADGAVIEVGGVELTIVHPGARVDEALARVGEATITRIGAASGPRSGGPGPAAPLLVTALFAGIVAALLWLG